MPDRIRTALIYGSARDGRFCDTVARWAAKEIAARPDFALDLVDPRIAAHHRSSGDLFADLSPLRGAIAEADAYVVVTPEYNHSFPASLKHLIDSFFEEWRAKPVAFISYGGLSGGVRATEHLRHVFAELHAVGIRDGVSFAYARARFDEAGEPREAEAAREAMRVMLDRLAWWANALRSARATTPYARTA
ncbi:NAD(P)H-dependent oxidoreductase [Terrarubrum flagellatum]|uniref:NADPH-dependent FMN reductase n=1 Tax=Terrirubrum flagellatum TaxID=2895980 RepID=UPI00314553FF